jgi:hypothetical protein
MMDHLQAHPGSYLFGIGGMASCGKQQFDKANHAPLSCVKVKNACSFLMVGTATLFLKLF